MRAQVEDVHDLARLADLRGDELRSQFRRALANLAQAAAKRALPLEGLDPEQLLRGVQAALRAGLFADLSWLSAPSAASALYELASALPPGEEHAALHRMVVERLAHADATTFVALATSLAQSSSSGLESARMRSRVSLALNLPMGAGARVDGLALALISQPEYAREWVEKPSQGSLPSRRLAARLLERAAREAAHRLQTRDEVGLRVLETAPVQAAWQRLLKDRESLVWRHVATARGLLAAAMPRVADEIERSLSPDLTPTEWRRGATSLAASIAVMPETALALSEKVLASEVVRRDPGVAAAMMMGLARALETEPDGAERLIVPCLRVGGLEAAEAFLSLCEEGLGDGFGAGAVAQVCALLSEQLKQPAAQKDDGTAAMLEWLLARFSGLSNDAAALDVAVRRAMYAFVDHGAGAAVFAADEAIAVARDAVARLSAANLETQAGRRQTVQVLHEIDLGLLQAATLSDVIALGEGGESARAALHDVLEQLTAWLTHVEQTPIAEVSLPHPALRMRQIRSLLHVVDADGSYGDDLSTERKPRRMRTVRVLLNRVRKDVASPVRRAVLACLARAFDALVREEVFELSDVLLCASLYVRDAKDVSTLAEASMLPELSSALGAFAALAERVPQATDRMAKREAVAALAALVESLPVAHSPRVSLLRWALMRVHQALSVWMHARSIGEVVRLKAGASGALPDVGEALLALAQLVAGTRRRLSPNAQVRPPHVPAVIAELGGALDEAVLGRDLERLGAASRALEECLATELPDLFSSVLLAAFAEVRALPFVAAREEPSAPFMLAAVSSLPLASRRLPAWMPFSRLLGGFYVLHPIGEGGSGSVFVARRSEQRNDARAESFALKVPEYDGNVSQVLSEADFLKLFREEASALLALPESEANLARFVTFDAGVRPKPILVMEFVAGPSLEKLLARRALDLPRAVSLLSGVGRGLSAMHKVGLAHLDLKPSNVIVRDPSPGKSATPVLVDFGLAGRRLRPGCGTANYAAPEVWAKSSGDRDPRPADVYAFGCLAYELITGRLLFEGASDRDVVQAHVAHDGVPAPLDRWHASPALRPLADWFKRCLRKDPRERTGIEEARCELAELEPLFARAKWPLPTR